MKQRMSLRTCLSVGVTNPFPFFFSPLRTALGQGGGGGVVVCGYAAHVLCNRGGWISSSAIWPSRTVGARHAPRCGLLPGDWSPQRPHHRLKCAAPCLISNRCTRQYLRRGAAPCVAVGVRTSGCVPLMSRGQGFGGGGGGAPDGEEEYRLLGE